MGDSAALVERMSTAVRTAYKAIEVLKEENKALKAENETLKLQLQALRGSQQLGTDDEDTPDASPISSPIALTSSSRVVHVAPISTFKPLQHSRLLHAKLEPVSPAQQPPRNAMQKKSGIVDIYIPVNCKSSILVEEHGLSKPTCSTNFGNSPEAKKIIVFLKELSLQNVHILAKSIAPVSMDTISKALMFTITSYTTTEMLCAWNNMFSAPLGSPPQLLPLSLLAQLDLLGNLVVSFASRTFNGMIRASKLMAIVKKVIVGAIRCQWLSPHYTLVMGTARSQRVAVHHAADSTATRSRDDHNVLSKIKHESMHVIGTDGDMDDTALRSRVDSDANSEGEESEDLDSRGHDGVPDEALSSDSESEGEETDGENEPITNPIPRPSLAAWGQANRSTAVPTSTSSDGVVVGEVGAAVVPQSARKAALSSMFGLDDSSDDEAEKEGMEEVEMNEEEEDVYMTNDNDMEVEDSETVVKHESGSEIQTNFTSEVPKIPTETDVADQVKCSAAGGGVLDHACKVYFLLSSLVRLRLAHDLVSTLQEMCLITVNNLSAGTIIGTVSVLGSTRFSAFRLPGVRAALIVLLRRWYAEMSTVLEEHSLSDGTNYATQVAALSITLVATQSLRDLVGAFLTHLAPKRALLPLQPPPTDIASLAQLLITPLDSADASSTHELRNQFRRHGFWGSLTQLNSLKIGLMWDKLGLSRLPVHVQKVEEMLLCWDPDLKHKTSITLSVKDFVNSDNYLFSPLQSVVQGTLKAARIAPERLIAEELLVQEFAAHWKDHLASVTGQNSSDMATEVLAITRPVWCLSELLQTFLSTEYDAPEGGWRSGLSGDGFRLSSRLDNRLTVGLALLQKLVDSGSTAAHFTASSVMVVLKPSLQWMHYSSLSSRKTLEYAEFLDHCAWEVFPEGAPSVDASSVLSESALIMHTAEVKLYAVCCEIAALMALASIESVVFVLVSSLRGLLSAMRSEMKLKKDKQLNSDVVGLAGEAIRCLCKLPSPWAGVSRADIQQELLESTRMLNTAEESHNRKTLLGADWMLRLAMCQPVFVINLDKRTDRYRRLLIMLDQASVSAVRIRAFDGTTTNQTSSLTPAEMFQRSFGTHPDALAVDSLLPAARAVPCIEDAYDSIPESDVQLTWDSTLNNKFDPRCPVNTRTVATPSERACAASHLRVWRAIAAVRGTKVAKSKLRGLQSLLSASSNTPSESALASPEVVYKDLLALKSGGHSSTTSAASGGSNSTSNSDKKDTPPTQLSVLEESLPPQEGLDYFIVFEDDVCFPQQSLVDLRATIHSIMRVLPPSVDILYLCGVLPKACAEFKLRNIKGDPFYSINYAWTLQAYVLRSRAVEVLLSKLPIFAPVDNFVASLIYHGELRACIVKDKLTQRLAGAILPGGGRKNDSDVRASGRSYSGLPKRSLSTPAGGKPDDNGEKKRKIDRRKRRKH